MTDEKYKCIHDVKAIFNGFEKVARYNIQIPTKTATELINLLLHALDIYKKNEMLEYVFHEHRNCFAKITIIKNDTESTDYFRVLNVTMSCFRQICDLIEMEEPDTIIDTLKGVFG